MKRIVKTGLFDHDTLTVKFGGEKSIPENIFTATAIRVPTYSYQVTERESLGGGWYGGMETHTKTDDNLYIIIRDGICIGQMHPHAKSNGYIKTQLSPCNSHAINFATRNNIMYRPDYKPTLNHYNP